jgi:septin family protein
LDHVRLTFPSILILGARSSGKTSFLNFLRTSFALPPTKKNGRPSDLPEDLFAGQGKKHGNFTSYYLESEIDGERVGLTLWDSEGLEKNVVDLQLRDINAFLESKFEDTFSEETKVVRAPGVQDTHIHCTFLLLDPLRLDRQIQEATKANSTTSINGAFVPPPRTATGLDEGLDLSVLRALRGKTMVVPIISKADTITSAHMTYLKKTVWDSLRKANIDPLEALDLDDEPESPLTSNSPSDADDSDDTERDRSPTILPIQSNSNSNSPRSSKSNRLSTGSLLQYRVPSSGAASKNGTPIPEEELPYLPLSIISPDLYEPDVIGRKFPWGFADPMDETHCDFVRLKETVFSDWRTELREFSRDSWYESWRSERLGERRPTRRA